ncbi:MAG: SDR family NAD(P)-dependent oxidoreductase [Bacteroidota bacterium]|nr:SDR family NAD(P)-dependent oxidoreductase [Bacteroidota bacterium]
MMKTILITGATAGIGKATAYKFAENKCRLIITGRREKILNEVAFEINEKYKVEVLPVCLDVRKNEDVEKAVSGLPKEWRNIDVLVNNAGLAVGLNPFYDGVIDDWERMIDTNVKGLLYVSKAVAKIMIENRKGHIINISSVAGKETYPNGNVYCATKHAVDSLTNGMRMELLQFGIKVTLINPGAVETEFSIVRFKGDNQRAKDTYKGYQPLTGADIAEAIFYTTTLPQHANINELTITPSAQATPMIFHKKN